jgi:hypothetical protein
MGSMNDLKELLDQMMVDISNQALRLDDVRLQFFLNWLNAHSSKMQSALSPGQTLIQMDGVQLRQGDLEEQIGSGLKTWFESLPTQGLLWEYHLILIEIAWWQNLDAHRLNLLLKSEAGK